MRMTGKKAEKIGIALTLVGCIPTIFWIVNFIQSRAMRSVDLFWGIPFICCGSYFLTKSKKVKDEKMIAG